MDSSYDALLILSFGGPERREDVIPFLENVLRGKPVPRERMLEVAEHYYHFEGVSPINAQTRELIRMVEAELRVVGIGLPVYWGNRNWHPLLADTVRQMARDGVRRALAWVTSAYSSYSSCRQYLENIAAARAEVGAEAPQIDKIRVFYNHPGFIEAQADRIRDALGQIPAERRGIVPVLFTAHSIPLKMAENCRYVAQLEETCRLVAESTGLPRWRLVYQSRSGPPPQPWLEPDLCQCLRAMHAEGGLAELLVVPVGFLSDHMEVLFDIDVEAQELARELGVRLIRAATAGNHPRFVRMIRELIQERLEPGHPREAIGKDGPSHDVCPADCCRYTVRRPGAA